MWWGFLQGRHLGAELSQRVLVAVSTALEGASPQHSQAKGGLQDDFWGKPHCGRRCREGSNCRHFSSRWVLSSHSLIVPEDTSFQIKIRLRALCCHKGSHRILMAYLRKELNGRSYMLTTCPSHLSEPPLCHFIWITWHSQCASHYYMLLSSCSVSGFASGFFSLQACVFLCTFDSLMCSVCARAALFHGKALE